MVISRDSNPNSANTTHRATQNVQNSQPTNQLTNHTHPKASGQLPLHLTTPPTIPLPLSFASLIPIFFRPAASTARPRTPSLLVSASAATRFFPFPRLYASAPKKKKMPPKKQVKEEKLPLGRPGNSLKSGIVRERPAPCCFVAFSH